MIYDRETGVDITPTILKDPPKREGKKTTQQVDFQVQNSIGRFGLLLLLHPPSEILALNFNMVFPVLPPVPRFTLGAESWRLLCV